MSVLPAGVRRLAAAGGVLMLLSPADARSQEACAGSVEPVTMEMLLEKTIFRVDVLELTVELRGDAAERLRALEREGGVTESLADTVARIAAGARCGRIVVDFVRDIPLRNYLDGTLSGLQSALDDGFITPETRQLIAESLPGWYAFLEGRGVRDGDRMTYGIRADTLHTEYRSGDGDVLLDRTDVGAARITALLSGYFASGSDFRESLIASFARTGSAAHLERTWR